MSRRPQTPKSPPPTDQCIFCGSKKLNREHIIAEWVQEFIEPIESYDTHYVSDPVTGHISPGRNHGRPGDALTHRLRVVCPSCNSGWMSALQQKAKPLLSELLMGRWPPLFGLKDQQLVALWAAMTSMVWEFADPKTIGVSQHDRDFLRVRQQLPLGWYVWVGRVDFGLLHPHNINHHGGKIGYRSGQKRGTLGPHQTTGLTLGRLLIQTMTKPPGLLLPFEEWERENGMVMIAPVHRENVIAPTRVHDWDSYYETTNFFVRCMGSSAFAIKKPKPWRTKSPFLAEQ